ncbi:MAG TPA: hypothetical protein VM618_08480, partial [Acidimicrobiia bacterium]|nr:hypothetical protein [Acidimicrobiia bacterium]
EPTSTIRDQAWRVAPLAFWLSAAGLSLWIVGVLLPWADIDVRIGSALGENYVESLVELFGGRFTPVSGYDLGTNVGLEPTEGRIVLVLGLAFGLLVVLHLLDRRSGRGFPIAMIVVSAVAFLVLAVELGDLWDARDVPGVSLDIGAGIWLSLIGALVSIAASVAFLRRGLGPPLVGERTPEATVVLDDEREDDLDRR